MLLKKTFFIFAFLFLISSLQANEYSPAVGKNYPTKLLWGDTHLHSNESADAWSIGNSNLTPSDAFRFARGEEVISESGVKAKLRVPLDFFMVSDHATYLGVFKRIEEDRTRPLLNTNNPFETGRELFESRKEIYESFKLYVETDNLLPREVTFEILKIYANFGQD